ncbi:filamentous hemagglutinin N-terminal domain-containing protein, partial [Polaromonas sp.]|uniref:two-partner secretion domain-containing protein n=1 Tax=Polaromonas sp. TaxID=1869339 RepID=UPI002735D11F
MNRIYQSIWSDSSGAFVAVSENAGGAGKKKSSSMTGCPSAASFAVTALSACLMFGLGASAYALPTGGVVAAGGASITSTASTTTITQSTANAAINWQSFGIAAGQTVQFVQPGSTSVALNRVLGADPSSIMGNLSANGRVFLLNPNGVLFGSGAQVNVGGLVASTMSLSDAKFMSGDYSFTDAGNGSVVNQGNITAADGGYVALMGKTVSNQGVISARLGSVALAAGNAVTMDVAGDGLLNVSVTQGAVNALVENGGMINADGGRVLLTAQAAGNLLQTAVNNTGVIQAQTIGNRNGTILLLGDMQSGTMNVSGTLDASAPNGGNGGFIETSAARVSIRDDVRVTTAAPQGLMGTWLIDPQDFIIGAGGNISGATLSA